MNRQTKEGGDLAKEGDDPERGERRRMTEPEQTETKRVEQLPIEEALRERLRALKEEGGRRGWTALVREYRALPSEVARAALEVSAGLAAVSLRVSGEFLQAVPEAARGFGQGAAEDLRAWGEMGRRLAMADVETGAAFFAAGAAELARVPRKARPLLFQLCARQMTLSSSIALETLRRAPEIARAVADARALSSIFEVALEISRRSAKHSADFLASTGGVTAGIERTRRAEAARRRRAEVAKQSEKKAETNVESSQRAGASGEGASVAEANVDESEAGESKVEAAGVDESKVRGTGDEGLMRGAVRLANSFAVRAGGIAADMWAALPSVLEGLSEAQARVLFREAEGFLDRGGAAALHVLVAGGEVLRLAPEAFEDWSGLLRAVAEQSNAGLVALARTSPSFFQSFAGQPRGARSLELARRVIAAAREVARVDGEAAISCFRSAPAALRSTSIEQFEQWARDGLEGVQPDARARRSYYALETRRSNDALKSGGTGLGLDEVAQTLRLYVEALTGHAVEVAPLAAVPEESRIGDGRTIQLPSTVGEFADDALNFRLYKVLAAHAAGQIEFGTHERAGDDLRAAYTSLAELYAPENVDARDAFALDGYINRIEEGERARAPEEEALASRAARRQLPPDADYRAALALFPQAGLAARIFGTLENGRIDRRLRHAYRGLARDLNLVREHLREGRPRITSLPVTVVPFELLFQITLCGGAKDDARGIYSQIVSELESIVADYLSSASASVADTLMATSRVYSLFQSIVPDLTQKEQQESPSEGEGSDEPGQDLEQETEEAREESAPESPQQKRDARELFNAWASTESMEADADEMLGAERWMRGETPEQDLEEGETAFAYDEWDRELADTRVGWCRVVEKRVRRGERSFVELTRSRYRGVISSIRHQFQLMKPENLRRVPRELDGEDFDLDAVIDYVADRRADGQQSERLYTKRIRRERDVAVSFLLDQSSSTARTIGRHPLQPYTHPGRRIIEVEKEGLVLMSEALEAVGDVYSIYGFTSEGRRNVKFYVIKDFKERYSEEIERRIGGINYQHNTRLGAAIRHAAARLQRQEARTRLLIVLSDGRPYDHDYGDARYAREDTREALRQARLDGITPFCITIDRDSEAELRDLYGEVGYTIIDNVLSLPERMPAIYRRLTT